MEATNMEGNDMKSLEQHAEELLKYFKKKKTSDDLKEKLCAQIEELTALQASTGESFRESLQRTDLLEQEKRNLQKEKEEYCQKATELKEENEKLSVQIQELTAQQASTEKLSRECAQRMEQLERENRILQKEKAKVSSECAQKISELEKENDNLKKAKAPSPVGFPGTSQMRALGAASQASLNPEIRAKFATMEGKLAEKDQHLKKAQQEKDSLSKQLIEKAEKVGVVETLLKGKDNEVQELRQKLAQNKADIRKSKGRERDLTARLETYKQDCQRLQVDLDNLRLSGVSTTLPEYIAKERELSMAQIKTENVQKELEHAKNQIADLRKAMETSTQNLDAVTIEKEQLEEDKRALQLMKDTLEQRNTAYDEIIKDRDRIFHNLQMEVDSLKQENDNLRRYEIECSDLKEKLCAQTEELTALQASTESAQRMEQLELANGNLQKEREKLSRECAQRMKQLEREKRDLQEEKAKMSSDSTRRIDELQKEILNLKNDNERLSRESAQRINHLEQENKAVKKAKDERDEIIAQLTADEQTLRKQTEQQEDQQRKLIDKLEKLKEINKKYALNGEELVATATRGRRLQSANHGSSHPLVSLAKMPTEFREPVPIIHLGNDGVTLELDDLILSRVIKSCKLDPGSTQVTLFTVVADSELASPIPSRLLARYLTSLNPGEKIPENWWTPQTVFRSGDKSDDIKFATLLDRRGVYLWPDPIKIRVGPNSPARVMFLVQAFSDLGSYPNPMLFLTHFLSSTQVVPLADSTKAATFKSFSQLTTFCGNVGNTYRREEAANILPEVVFLLSAGNQSKSPADFGWLPGQQRVVQLLRSTDDCACLKSSPNLNGFVMPQLRENPSTPLLRQVFTPEYREQFSLFCESVFNHPHIHLKCGFDGQAVTLGELTQFAEWAVNLANLTDRPNNLQLQYYHRAVAMTTAEKVANMLASTPALP